VGHGGGPGGPLGRAGNGAAGAPLSPGRCARSRAVSRCRGVGAERALGRGKEHGPLTRVSMAARDASGARAAAAPVSEERRSRIGALKQQLVQSDNDMAKLEDHIRGLLIKSKGTWEHHHHPGPTGASPRLPSPFRAAPRRVPPSDAPAAQLAGATRLPDVPAPTAASPWAVLQVPEEADELKRQLEGAWRECDRAKAQALADKLTIQDLRQKLVDASQLEQHGSELHARLHVATEASSDKDRMIRLLEEEVAELRCDAQRDPPVHLHPGRAMLRDSA